MSTKVIKTIVSGDAPFKVRCCHCGETIDSVMLDCFDHDGNDSDVRHEFSLMGYNPSDEPFVEVLTTAAWTGEDLSDEERIEAITCPKCGKHPFGCQSNRADGSVVPPNLERMLSIVMFPNKEDVEDVASPKAGATAKGSAPAAPSAGNAQSMREALENIAEYAKSAACHTEDAHVLSFLDQIANWVKSALAAPARNCDVGAAKEQVVRFDTFVRDRRGDLNCTGKCPAHNGVDFGVVDCVLQWEQMPYENGKGVTDGR